MTPPERSCSTTSCRSTWPGVEKHWKSHDIFGISLYIYVIYWYIGKWEYIYILIGYNKNNTSNTNNNHNSIKGSRCIMHIRGILGSIMIYYDIFWNSKGCLTGIIRGYLHEIFSIDIFIVGSSMWFNMLQDCMTCHCTLVRFSSEMRKA